MFSAKLGEYSSLINVLLLLEEEKQPVISI